MTPHIKAQKGEIAKTVLMPGDPLRAKMVAEKYLKNVKLVSDVRGIPAYTGFYKDKEVTVMASGMGMPSIGIYSYELYKFYDVENIIRIGTAGAYTDKLSLLDLVLVDKAYSESSYAENQNGYLERTIDSDSSLNNIILETATDIQIPILTGTIHSSDVFYSDVCDFNKLRDEHNCLGVEMESFSLFHNAKVLNKKATCILTISDSFLFEKNLTSEERQNSLHQMITLALESAIKM